MTYEEMYELILKTFVAKYIIISTTITFQPLSHKHKEA